MGFDIAPYGQAIAEGSKLGQMVMGTVNNILNRVLPREKMTEQQKAELDFATQQAIMAQDWAGVEKEYMDRASARVLAQADAEKGSWFTNSLAATVRPFFGYLCMTAFIVPLVTRFVAVFAGYALTPEQVEMLTPNQIEKEIILTVIYFYFGGRTVEKGIALWKGAK